MKLLVISDTLDPEKSIIPYSLRLARSMNIYVTVLHIVDRRIVRGNYSAYADSQTVSMGVESFEDTLRKELVQAEAFLGKLISREASVLNFPLRVDYKVVEDNIEERLIAESRVNENGIILIASQPDGRFWQDHQDITYVANRLFCPVILVPRRKDYVHPGKVQFNRLTNWADSGHLDHVISFIGEMGIHSDTISRKEPLEKFDPKDQSEKEMLVILQNRPVFLKRLFAMRLSTVLTTNSHIPILLVNFRTNKTSDRPAGLMEMKDRGSFAQSPQIRPDRDLALSRLDDR